MSQFYKELQNQIASQKILASQKVREEISKLQGQYRDVKNNVEIGALPASSLKSFVEKQNREKVTPIFERYGAEIAEIHNTAIQQYKDQVAVNKRNLPTDNITESMILQMIANNMPVDNILNVCDRNLLTCANGIENAVNILQNRVDFSEEQQLKIHQFGDKVATTITVLTEGGFLAELEANASIDNMILRQSDEQNFAMCPLTPGTPPTFVEVWTGVEE